MPGIIADTVILRRTAAPFTQDPAVLFAFSGHSITPSNRVCNNVLLLCVYLTPLCIICQPSFCLYATFNLDNADGEC